MADTAYFTREQVIAAVARAVPEFHDQDEDTQRDIVSAERYVLIDVGLDRLHTPAGWVDPERVPPYADQLKVSEPPPIVVSGNGRIEDGNHRAAAARMAERTTIRAYVPI